MHLVMTWTSLAIAVFSHSETQRHGRQRFRCVTVEQNAASAACLPPACQFTPIKYNASEPSCVAMQSTLQKLVNVDATFNYQSGPFARTADSLEMMMSDVEVNHVPGDVMETGVWTGRHSLVLAASIFAHGAFERNQWLCDSFNGIPFPNAEKFKADKNEVRKANAPSRTRLKLGGPETTQENFRAAHLLGQGLKQHWVVGYFNETMPSLRHAIKSLAILRLDGDIYQSTYEVLVTMYEKVSIGGYIVIDDMHIPACVKAVNDFRGKYDIREPIQTVRTPDMHLPGTGSYWKKKKQIKVPHADVLPVFS